MVKPNWHYEKNYLMEKISWIDGKSKFSDIVYHTKKSDLIEQYRRDSDVKTTWRLKPLLENIDDIDNYLSIPYEIPKLDMSPIWTAQEFLVDRGLAMISFLDPVGKVAKLFGMDRFLIFAMTQTKKIKCLLDIVHERYMHQLSEVLKHDVTEVIFRICGPEYATPPFLSPEIFRELVTPYLTEICGRINDAGGYSRVHCHGNVARVLDQIVEAGAKGLDPIEPPPDGDITLKEVKSLYGKQMCLFGNIELKELETSKPERIDYLVKEAMDSAKEGSGFVLMPTAAPINIPLSEKTKSNYLKYIEAGIEYGKY